MAATRLTPLPHEIKVELVIEESKALPFRSLPKTCPCCQRRLVWGWIEEEFSEPLDCPERTAGIHIARIPRPDQTFFCPDCESRILN